MTLDEVRQQALDRVFREHPEWIGATDSVTLARVQQLQETYIGEISLAREVEELRRKQFAEEARKQGEAARAQRAAEAREAAESARAEREAAEREREREGHERLLQMNPVSRTVRTHPIMIGGALLVLVLAVLTIGVAVRSNGQGTADQATPTTPVPESLSPTENANVLTWEPFNCLNYTWYQKKFSIRWNNTTGAKQTVTVTARTKASSPYNWIDVIPEGESVDTYATGSAFSGPSDYSSGSDLACDAPNFVSVR